MRVFLDTNVLASATATRGLCADVLRGVFASHMLIVCDPLLSELDRVLVEKFHVPVDIVADVLGLLRKDNVFANVGALPQVSIRDSDDLLILACALAGKADILVTGDKELLGLKQVGSIDIVSPRQFWERLKSQQQHEV